MTADWKIVGHHTGEMIVTIDGGEWAAALKEAKDRLEERSKQVGTSTDEIERSAIYGVALNLNIKKIFAEGTVMLHLDPVSEPKIDVKKIDAEGAVVSFIFSVKPCFDIPDLSLLKYVIKEPQVSNEEIESAIEEMKQTFIKKYSSLPDDMNDFAADMNIEGVNNLSDLKRSIYELLLDDKQQMAQNDADDKLVDDLCDLVELDAPDGMVDMETDSIICGRKDELASRNISFEEYLKSIKMNEEQYKESLKPEAAKNIKARLIFEKIAEENDLLPDESDIDKEYEMMGRTYKMDPDDLRKVFPEDDMRYQKRLTMAFDHVKKMIMQ